jgi:hypothetical protein
MINKKDFPVLVFQSRSLFPTRALLPGVQISQR